MRKKYKYFLITSLFIAGIGLISILNLRVSTYQGLDYKVTAVRIPLYLKIGSFLSRHYHYKELTRRITKECNTDEEKIFTLFKWTQENIRKVPADSPIYDDHVYNIIIRGYGTDDQSVDVFTTLCVYAGIDAFWTWILPKNSKLQYAVSFVKLKERWLVFDSYAGNYFKNKQGKIASVDDIISDSSIVKNGTNQPVIYGVDYVKYFESLSPIEEKVFLRAKMHMPWPRIIYEFRKRLSIAE